MTDRIIAFVNPTTGKIDPGLIPAGSSGTSGGTGLPTGGTAGQTLTKKSTTDGDAQWATVPLRDFTFYAPGSLSAIVLPVRQAVPATGIRLDSITASVDAAGSGGRTVFKLMVGASEVGGGAFEAGALTASEVTVSATAIAAGAQLRVAVTSVPSSPPRDLSLTVWWR